MLKLLERKPKSDGTQKTNIGKLIQEKIDLFK